MSLPVLEMRNVSKSVGVPPRQLFAGFGLCLQAGETAAVTGPSGSGKSTLLNMAGGLDLAFSGDVLVNGDAVQSMDDQQRSHLRLRTVGMVFQSFHLLDHLSLLGNVLLPARFAPREELAALRVRAQELLDHVGLGARAQGFPNVLSGGEKQRVAIARALLMRPLLLLADEPTGNLDRATADGVMAMFASLVASQGTALLLVTHDPAVAASCQRTIPITAPAREAA